MKDVYVPPKTMKSFHASKPSPFPGTRGEGKSSTSSMSARQDITNVSQVRSARNPEKVVDYKNDVARNPLRVISAAPRNE